MPDTLAGIDTVILAGGQGTRLAGVLGDTPKVLAPLGGKPFLDILLVRLGEFGARRVILALGHLADAVTRHLARTDPPLEIVPVIEPEPLGTAGALRLAWQQAHSDPVLVMNGDSSVDADLAAFVAAHHGSGAQVSLIAAEVDDAGRFGALELSANARVVRFREKSPAAKAGYVNAGVYLFSASFRETLEAMPGPSLEHDVFEKLPPQTIHAFAGAFDFFDIGTPQSLAAAGGGRP